MKQIKNEKGLRGLMFELHYTRAFLRQKREAIEAPGGLFNTTCRDMKYTLDLAIKCLERVDKEVFAIEDVQ